MENDKNMAFRDCNFNLIFSCQKEGPRQSKYDHFLRSEVRVCQGKSCNLQMRNQVSMIKGNIKLCKMVSELFFY